MSEMIQLSVPCIKGNAWSYVKECLDTGWVSSVGTFVDKFEEGLRKYTGSGYAVACVNGTSALQVSLRIVGVSEGDEVIVPTLTFIATANAAQYIGATPIFMDCDDYYNIDAEKTLEFIKKETTYRKGHTYNKITGRKIAAVVPVHVFGNAARLDMLVAKCKERNISIVEDATESLGTRYRGDILAGLHTGLIGDIGCFSFNGNKIITTGGGGMIVTNNLHYAERAKYLTTQAKDDGIRYIHNDVGYNFRLTNIQAALGVAQLECLDEYLSTKRENYRWFKEHICIIPGLCIGELPKYADNNCWMYALQIDRSVYRKSREELMQYLLQRGIQTRPVWYLNHLQMPYRKCQHYRIERANILIDITLNIPCSVTLTREEKTMIIESLKNG